MPFHTCPQTSFPLDVHRLPNDPNFRIRRSATERPPASLSGHEGELQGLGCSWDDASSHSLYQMRWPWPPPERSKLVHAARCSQNLKFHQIWTRSRASADPDAPHGPGSNTKGYLGTDHTQGIPEQPEITRDCLISQNGRVHKVFVHMLRRIYTSAGHNHRPLRVTTKNHAIMRRTHNHA